MQIVDKAETRALIESDPEVAIGILSESPELLNRLHRGHKTAKYLWELAHGIAKEQRADQAEAAARAEDAPTPEDIENRKRIEQSEAFKVRTHPGHKKAHRAWLKTFQQGKA